MHPEDAGPTADDDQLAVRCVAQRATADDLWYLLATPACWPQWAPHIRRVSAPANRDGGQTLTAGSPQRDADRDRAAGVAQAPLPVALTIGDPVRIDGVVPVHVTARISLVDPPRRWDFVVDLPLGHRLVSTHEVEPDPAAVRVGMRLEGPATPDPVGRALLAAYRPIASIAVRRLVRLADAGGAVAARRDGLGATDGVPAGAEVQRAGSTTDAGLIGADGEHPPGADADVDEH